MSTPLPMTAADPRPLWYKDAVIYQLHVKTFADSYSGGIGDFKGLSGIQCVFLVQVEAFLAVRVR